ncbi:MAG: hypothetical protein AB4062_04130 [Crocosphaera sp.]
MKKSFLPQLIEPSDGLKLREGACLDPRITSEMLSEENIINASEILIDINESDNLSSQNELISRALSFGWTPLKYEEKLLIEETKLKTYKSSKINFKYKIIIVGLSQVIGLVYLFLFPTTVSYLLSFTVLVCLLPIYPMLLFFDRDIMKNTWEILKGFRFEPNYLVELKNTLYNYLDYLFSTSNEQVWIYLNNEFDKIFLADQILLMFLIIVTFIFLFLSLFLQSILMKKSN